MASAARERFPEALSTLPRAQRKQRADTIVAQPKAGPHDNAEEKRHQEWIAHPHVCRDGASEIAGEQHGAEGGRARHEVDGSARELEEPDGRERSFRIAEPGAPD